MSARKGVRLREIRDRCAEVSGLCAPPVEPASVRDAHPSCRISEKRDCLGNELDPDGLQSLNME